MKKFRSIIAFLAISFALFMVINGRISDKKDTSLLEAQGVEVQGEVVDMRVSNSRRSTTYYITYIFSNEEGRFQEEAKVDPDFHNSLNVTDMVSVVYVDNDPSISRIAGNDRDDNPVWAVVVFSILLLVSLYSIKHSFSGKEKETTE